MIEVKEHKDVWLTIGNTDNTEGRGYPVILYVCESFETANRLGKKRFVQGSDCPVEKSVAVKVGNRWLVPGSIEAESAEDERLRLTKESKQSVIDKMRLSGFTEDEISRLSQ